MEMTHFTDFPSVQEHLFREQQATMQATTTPLSLRTGLSFSSSKILPHLPCWSCPNVTLMWDDEAQIYHLKEVTSTRMAGGIEFNYGALVE